MTFNVGDKVSWYIRPEVQDPECPNSYITTDRMVGIVKSIFSDFMMVVVDYPLGQPPFDFPHTVHYAVDLNNTSLKKED